MAEASSTSSNFFCHRCSQSITPRLPDYTCPRCHSGFIEELPAAARAESASSSFGSDQAGSTSESRHQPSSFFSLGRGYGPFSLGIFDHLSTEQDDGEAASASPPLHPWQQYISGFGRQPQQSSSRQQQPQPSSPQQQQRQAPTLEGGSRGSLHSSPMDYAWGSNGLDAIITHLLNQFENSGPPPADREAIRRLPTIEITQQHVASGLECSVCREDFKRGESARRLPCTHTFHSSCIVTWLEQHDTCPVCRKSLSGRNTATDPPDFH
ncbi:E3 ubiquitin-protein ligase RNF126-A-like isoform X2 [Engraulis encrasicolus]|uniref:E3 ubiquitin-protein ligase RNF126-A-like isoform X2 n=1 Tax=Engraulis encrasicolus TaxID=184585 RepID=UPI002FD56E08